MNNPYITEQEARNMACAKKYILNNMPVEHEPFVFAKNTVLNRINTLEGKRDNNPLGSQKHHDYVYSLLLKNLRELREMRCGK